MKALARAVVSAIAFLKLPEDDVIDPDSAVQAMEIMRAELANTTTEKKRALEETVAEALSAHESAHASGETLEFYRNFMTNFC